VSKVGLLEEDTQRRIGGGEGSSVEANVGGEEIKGAVAERAAKRGPSRRGEDCCHARRQVRALGSGGGRSRRAGIRPMRVASGAGES
jgi:hypothetical protein